MVPDLDCQFVLKAVPVEECKPTVKQDCRDEAIEKPYLEEEEECFEVVYDECFLVGALDFSPTLPLPNFRLRNRFEL